LKVAILEYICGSGLFRDGANHGESAPLNTLLQEGYAMLSALTCDMIDAGIEVESPLEPSIAARLGGSISNDASWTWSPVPFNPDRTVDDVAKRWIESISSCDAAIVIAPELDGILPHVTAQLRKSCIPVLAGDEPFLITACDQWETCRAWKMAQVLHPDTYLLEDFLRSTPIDFHDRGWVIKRRDSAGCVGMQRFENSRTLVQHAERLLKRRTPSDPPADRWIVQPWIPGRAASIAVLCGHEPCSLGSFEQRIEFLGDGNASQWGYLGGDGPIPGVTLPDLNRFARRILKALPGLPLGWIGVDFVIQPNGPWCAIEVNPRLTTSYLGYRKWYGHSLARSWACGDSFPTEWREFPRVCFSAAAIEG
jgi:predicted ATP-grasp superfamily ATP-dependent carboligase